MKMISKVLLTAAAIAALATPALAAVGDTKLIIKDDAGSANVFTVDNTGTAKGAKMGLGTTAPQSPLHLHAKTALGAVTDPSDKLYYSGAGLSATAQDNSVQGDFIVADGTLSAGYAGVVRGVRARGSLAVPAVPLTDDVVFKINGGIWDGGKVYNTAEISLKVDGPVSSNVAPQRIVFNTRTNGTGAYTEKMVIKHDGRIRFSNQPAAPAHTDACTTGDTIWTGGYLYFCIASGNWGRATFAAY